MSEVIGTAQINVVTDASDVDAGVARAKKSIASLGEAASSAGQQATDGLKGVGEGVRKVGDGSDTSARKVEVATRGMIQSIQRTTAVMEAGSKTSSKYFEVLAAQRGIDINALRPYLTQLEQVSVKQANTGVSAGQMSAALRGVPAQFTDIATSIAAGQNPLTVFLQQGGQLKDMFGGIGPAAKALGGYVVGLINPFTVAAGAAAALAVAYNQGSKEADAYNKALIMTGNAAGTTADQLADMARNISDSVGTQGKAAEALAQMAGTGRVAAGNLEYFAAVAVKMEKTVGIAASQAAEDLASLGKTPLEASERLSDKYRYLTSAIYEQIKALQEQGRVEDAAKVAQEAYANAFDQRAKSVVDNLGYMERGWNAVAGAAKRGWDAIRDVGRPETDSERLDVIADQIASAQVKLERLQQLGPGKDTQLAIKSQQSRIDALRLEQSFLQETLRMQGRSAEIAAVNQRQDESRIKWLKDGEQYLSRAAQMERDIAKARGEGAAAGATSAEIEARVGAIRAKYTTSEIASSEKLAEQRKKLIASGVELAEGLLSQSNGLSGNFFKKWDQLSLAHKAGAISTDKLTKAQAELLTQQPAIKAAATSEAKAIADAAKAQDEYNKALSSHLGGLDSQARGLEEQLELYGKTEAQIAKVNLQRAQERLEIAKRNGVSPEYIAALEQEVKLRERIVSAAGNLELKKANEEAANQAAVDWQRTADTIEQSLTDALMRGFEDGKDFAENFRDTLINMFKALVLRPLIQPVAQGGANMIMGAVGMGPGGGGSGGYGNALSWANSGYNAWQIGGQWAAGSMSGANAAGTLYANATGGGLDGLLATNGAYGTAPAATGGFGSTLAGGGGALAGAYLGYQATGGNLGGAALGGVAGYGAASGVASGAGAYAGMTASLSSIPVWGWIAIAALAIYSATAKGGTPHMGAAAFTDLDDSQRLLKHEESVGDTVVWGGFKGAEKAFEEPLRSMGLGVAKTVEDTLENFGVGRQVSVYSAFGADDDDPSRGNLRVYNEDGSLLAANSDQSKRGKKYDDDPRKGFEEFVDDSGRVVRDALVAADLPGWVDDVLTSLGDAPGLALVNQTIAQITAIKATAERLGPALGITAEGLAGVVEQTGNFDAAMQMLNTYAELSLTSAEKWGLAQQALVDGFDAIGASVPQSTDEFERLIKGIDQTTDAGQELYTGLLALAPAFYSVANAVEEAFDSISKSTADLIQQFTLDTLSDEQRYAFFDQKIAELDQKIAIATDPAEITRLIDERNRAQSSAWGLLSDEEKRRLLPDFTDVAMDGEALAQSRLSVTPIDSADTERKQVEREDRAAAKTQEAVKTGISEGLMDAAAKMAQAGMDQAAAAALIKSAADSLLATASGYEVGRG